MKRLPESAVNPAQPSDGQALRGTRKRIELKALAKINLGLDVLGKRENGYHDVRMVMQSIYLYDDVRIERTKNPGIEVKTNLYFLPTDENNIAYKAAAMLIEEFQIHEGVVITLDKHIPVAAGMAGGSSNAAAVLFGMNKMFGLGLSKQELMERGVKLGADVPYCIMRGTVLAEGIGEELTVLPAMPKCTVLVAKPGISVSTKVVYEALDSKEIVKHPNIDALLAGLEKGSLREVAAAMGNVLEDVTIPMYPVIEDIKNVMKEEGAMNAMMSGSGPTVFGLFENKAQARKAQEKIREKALAKQVYVTNIHGARRNEYGA
ncbi:4-(cytidine 5'-diphospho)-2-C-methyl-D-erythritol kinase [Faecalicatena sp. AGMB00832]|uniref:4-diphosphocytidyl-2-C-methyl-D-erythritol kinase n=1 Tax=Faecalicatena faecalis TaxID=2726362 RepID=A0ABS6D820_9FIRM|nr:MULTISPECIES: 4-(cytidine 5'-diphospho)-2-C-methyl-D-erythritol kinase [Faecalicatena]MBU3877619.1 4-(cytidine 5'-diphospho)-2-C-methyl-D-erythritol kinase [Faecalicatena faecalis]MCI6463926.1 4-(cytidine 5'-diphospho)-2-C-methyl-D-erythritol kinase [Faecalicatena sp.]MDY5620826.1 4-(cytidine 5'-diphospho)-2-C-methyl-D-erythritol kinase [Lachnospiraceae bacterium]